MDVGNDNDPRLTQLTDLVSLLQEENRWLKSQLFGRSSEKRPQELAAEQQRLFNEAEALAAARPEAAQSVTILAYTRKKGSKKIPATLPRIEVIHDLPESEKVCPHDGTALTRIGVETAEQLHLWCPPSRRS
ncbi:MAG: transposase [Proteobacteria bacterium]|nr:transposase [Pseudomonadota bacterium]